MMKTIDERSMLETTSLRIIQCVSTSSTTSSSSIGNNSDTDDQHDDDIQSPYHNNNDSNNGSGSSSSSFDDAIQVLEQALPIRRGISTFYNGKSKSFTSLNKEWPTSIQDIAKPETPYTRKRKNLAAFKLPNINTARISTNPKRRHCTLHFTLERENVNHHNFTDDDHATLSQINRPLQSRSFSMVNLFR